MVVGPGERPVGSLFFDFRFMVNQSNLGRSDGGDNRI